MKRKKNFFFFQSVIVFRYKLLNYNRILLRIMYSIVLIIFILRQKKQQQSRNQIQMAFLGKLNMQWFIIVFILQIIMLWLSTTVFFITFEIVFVTFFFKLILSEVWSILLRKYIGNIFFYICHIAMTNNLITF